MADGFHIGRAVAGLLACPLPVVHRLLRETCLGVVLGHQLRLGLHGCGETGFQNPGNALVELLPDAAQQRLIRGLLNQRMLEHIRRLRRYTPLVH
jgi:hypothetical protein